MRQRSFEIFLMSFILQLYLGKGVTRACAHEKRVLGRHAFCNDNIQDRYNVRCSVCGRANTFAPRRLLHHTLPYPAMPIKTTKRLCI